MVEELVVTSDQFIVLRDDRVVAIADNRKKAEKIAKHFKRLQPASKIVVQHTALEREELEVSA